MIAHGKLVAFDTPENLEKQMRASSEILLTVEGTQEQVARILSEVPQITSSQLSVTGSQVHATLKTDCEDVSSLTRTLFQTFAENKLVILEMTTKKANLEDVFIELSENKEESEG